MTPKIVCGRCGNEIESSDKYCSSCGASVEWKGSSPSPQAAVAAAAVSDGISCPLCGHNNSPGSTYCESCGGALQPRSTPREERPEGKSSTSPKLPRLKALQSWKLTLGLGIVLIGALVIMKSSRNDAPPASGGDSPHASGAAQEIRTLQQTVDANPKDPGPILRLANLYHDVRLFPKAIAWYERYLDLNPSNPDARVDLGTSYFELSFEDTTRKSECLAAAKDAMERALAYSPKHQLALFNLGIILFHTGESEKALESFRKCVTVDSTSDVGRKAMQFVSQHSSLESSS